MSLPTGCCSKSALIVLTIELTGWFSAKARTGAGIEAVGTNAELMNGRKMIGYEKAPAPSADFAVNPAITAIQVSVTATVMMMCGCPITTPTWPQASGGPEPYWPYPEINVFATLTDPSGNPTTQPMTFSAENTFTASFALPNRGQSTIGVYAVQQAETNVGFAQREFEM